MGDILVPAIILLIVIAGGSYALSASRSAANQRKALLKAPAILHTEGEPPDVLLANAQRNYLIAQRAARLLDRLVNNAALPLAEKDRKEAQSILSDFYK